MKSAKTCTAIAVIDLGDCTPSSDPPSISQLAERNLCGQSLLARMVGRLLESTLADRIVIAGNQLSPMLVSHGIAGAVVLDLPKSSLCERLVAAADRYDADWVLYLPATRPFLDPVLIDRLLSNAMRSQEVDYLGYFSPTGGWNRMQHLGLAGEVCNVDSLRRLQNHADQLAGTTNTSMAAFFQQVTGVYQLKFAPIPAELDREDLRFAINSDGDWDDAVVLCEHLPPHQMDWQPLAGLVMSNELVRHSMKERNRSESSNFA